MLRSCRNLRSLPISTTTRQPWTVQFSSGSPLVVVLSRKHRELQQRHWRHEDGRSSDRWICSQPSLINNIPNASTRPHSQHHSHQHQRQHHHHHHFHSQVKDYPPWMKESRRAFSSSQNNDNANTPTDNEPKKAQETTMESPLHVTDPDFVDYLTGPSTGDGDLLGGDNHNNNMMSNNNNSRLSDEVPMPSSNNRGGAVDAAAGRSFKKRKLEMKQHLDTARSKTVKNVQRALAGNVVICGAKLGAWLSSGSPSMLSEFVHSCVDCGNQSLLLVGLRDSRNLADGTHPYGYGKSVYFWALVSALGTFFLGAGVSMTHAVGELINPSSIIADYGPEVGAVLAFSLVVDGYVLSRTLYEVRSTVPDGMSFWKHVSQLRDPATLAILLEDGAACLGIVMACTGIAATHASGLVVFDGLAGVSISALLATMGIILVRVNHRFLLGQAVDRDITGGIERILLARRSIDHVHSVQSQWTGPDTFSYKAEVDFDGTFLAAKLMPRYQSEFLQVNNNNHNNSNSNSNSNHGGTTLQPSSSSSDLRVLLSWYAEDVMRTVEREVRHIESEIRKEYPGAEYIELEPMSKDADRFAIDDGMEAQLRRIEIEALNRYLKSLYHNHPTSPQPTPATTSTGTDTPSSSTHKNSSSTGSPKKDGTE